MSHLRTLPRYIVTGGLAFIIDLAITMGLAEVMFYLIANSVAFFIANLIQFFLVHRWVFRRPYAGHRMFVLYVATLGISMFGLLASTAIVYVGVEHVQLSLPVVKCVAAVVVLLLNYVLRAAFVYGTPKSTF